MFQKKGKHAKQRNSRCGDLVGMVRLRSLLVEQRRWDVIRNTFRYYTMIGTQYSKTNVIYKHCKKFGYACYINTQQHNCVGRFYVYNFINCSSHLDLLFSNYCPEYAMCMHDNISY